MATCPNCGGSNFRFELRSAGTTSKSNYYRTGIKKSWILPAGQKTRTSQRYQKSVGICQDCGYILDNEAQSKAAGAWIIVVLVVVFIVYMFVKEKKQEKDIANENVWPSTYASLEDFDYYVEGGEIYLENYHGDSEKVRIASTYVINGETCTVVSLDTTFALDSVISVVVPEGVRSMSNNVFNSCGLKFVYLPSTLTDFNGWDYFHELKKLYYGGTEDQWKNLYDGKKALDAEQIITGANADQLR